MNSRFDKVAEVARLAQNFRLRAAETGDDAYRSLMMRAALELEEQVQELARRSGNRLIQVDDGEEESPS